MAAPSRSIPGTSKKVLDVLVAAAVITPEQHAAAVEHVMRTGERAEESVLDLGFAVEPDLLRALAAHHKTNFVSTEKLAKADIPPATLDMIPRRFAETAGVFPVVFDPKTHTLSVVTADPDNAAALQEAQLASGAREVRAIVARPAAVKAAVAKAYGGDIHAFALLDRAAHMQFQAMLDVYERNLVSDSSMVTALAKEATAKQRERVVSPEQLSRAGAAGQPSAGVGGLRRDQLFELLNVLVSLLEGGRPELRGHSAQVARLARQMAERLSLDEPTTAALTAAAYLHDLGKMGQFHLTALNVGQYDGHKTAAQKAHSTPMRLLESVHLPDETLEAITHMYERYDGGGFPDGVAGKDIPLAARILSLVDTYADLTCNPRNPFRKVLEPADACGVLAQHKETMFDPNLVDLFRHVTMGEDIKARLLANRYNVLLVDMDPEESTVVELRMIEQGFEVKTARSAEQALQILSQGEVDLVVSDIDLGQTDGLKLLAEARKTAWGKALPWVIHTRRHDRETAQRALELAVVDYVHKPAPTGVLVAKLKALLDQRAAPRGSRGVSGSLREVSLPDLVQVLFNGRKTGNLKIRTARDSGEIHFQDGAVVNALWGELRGTDAFFQMLAVPEGEFGLDPTFIPPARVIHQSSDSLLLEGMRRLDEGLVET